jgi:ketosteroid isomerase-like protein
VTASDDLDRVIEQSHEALGEFVKGDPEPFKALASHGEDVVWGNPFFSFTRGWAGASDAMERAALNFREGEATGFELIARYEAPGLACIAEIERYTTKIGGREEPSPVALRVTSVLRIEDGAWKIVHRHADPITTDQPAESITRT